MATNDPLSELFISTDRKACCASFYSNPVVRWLVGESLHPGGDRLTRRLAELANIKQSDRVLDLATGTGASAVLLSEEHGCEVLGIDSSEEMIAQARQSASACGCTDVSFGCDDAQSLALASASCDVVLCECSLSTFTDKAQAVAEIARVLTGGGRLALADVTADQAQLDERLQTMAAEVACVGAALARSAYERLLNEAGLSVTAAENHNDPLLAMVDRVEGRLRLARMVQGSDTQPLKRGLTEAIEMCALARGAIEQGSLGYFALVAVKEPL